MKNTDNQQSIAELQQAIRNKSYEVFKLIRETEIAADQIKQWQAQIGQGSREIDDMEKQLAAIEKGNSGSSTC